VRERESESERDALCMRQKSERERGVKTRERGIFFVERE